jgi:hypothetical protein
MSLSLPNNPASGQQTTQNGRTYEWDGYAWNIVNNIINHATTHSSSGVDPITISASQVSNFNSSVSGLLPVTGITAGSGISINYASSIYTINLKAYSTTIGDGSATSYTVNHNLSVSQDVHVSVRDTGTNYYVYPDIKYVSNNSVLLEFVSPPTSNQYKVSIIGF